VTAITAGGDNTDLQADSAWAPLGTTPNHPGYPSAHGCVTGAVSSLIAGVLVQREMENWRSPLASITPYLASLSGTKSPNALVGGGTGGG